MACLQSSVWASFKLPTLWGSSSIPWRVVLCSKISATNEAVFRSVKPSCCEDVLSVQHNQVWLRGEPPRPFIPTASLCRRTEVPQTLTLGPKGQQKDSASWLRCVALLNIHALYHSTSCKSSSWWSGKAAWKVLRAPRSGRRDGREILLIFDPLVVFSSFLFSFFPLPALQSRLWTLTCRQIYFLSMIRTHFGCASQYASAVRNQQQTECNTRKPCWFDFSCTGGFLSSFVTPQKTASILRKGMLHRQVHTKPLWRNPTAASRPRRERAGGLGAFHLFSLSLFIEAGRSDRDPCPCSAVSLPGC